MMEEKEKCIPWYLPPVDPEARPCSPYEATRFTKYMESQNDKDCEVKSVEIDMGILLTGLVNFVFTI